MTIPNPLKGYLGVQKPFDRKLIALLEVVAKSLIARIERVSKGTRFSDSVRASQLRAVLVEIRKEQIRMFNEVGDIIRAGQLAASIQAIDQLGDVARVITASMSKAAADELIDSVLATSRAGIKNLYARTPRALSSRLYDNAALTSGKIEEMIRAGIGSGLSARELARDIRQYVSPAVPGGSSYVTMRLARTEINNAFHNQQIAGMDAPGVLGAKWNLSGSHPRPDECNRLAQSDQYNMGVGVFPRGKVPGKPHPQCLCYLSYVTMDPDRFVSELRKGTFDKDLRDRYKANLELIRGTTPITPPRPVKAVVPSAKARDMFAPKPKATTPRAPKAKQFKVPAALDNHLRMVNSIMGTRREPFQRELHNQAAHAPKAMRSLNSVDVLSGDELLMFEKTYGKDAVGGYLFDARRLVSTPRVFDEGFEALCKAELKSGWSSKWGHTGIESFVAHECGHHIDNVLGYGTIYRKNVWDSIAAELKLTKPNAYDLNGLNGYVAHNRDLFESKVSRYGASDSREVLAEIWAEYTTNPNARAHIKRIGRVIQDSVEAAA